MNAYLTYYGYFGWLVLLAYIQNQLPRIVTKQERIRNRTVTRYNWVFAFLAAAPLVYLAAKRGRFVDTGMYIRSFQNAPSSFRAIPDYLNGIKDTRDMVKKCIAGIDISELKKLGKISGFYATRDTGRMILDPIPNILFQRDPMATIGNGATLHKMWSVTRTRESIFMEYVYEYHPFYKGTKLYYDRTEPYCIEGGDIQVLSSEVVAIGISQRTEPDAIADFARNLFKDKKNSFKYVLAIDIPDERSFMHLDTVMTQVDVDKFAVQDAIMDISTIYEISAGRGGEIEIMEIHQNLTKVLEKYLHLNKVELIKCGNGRRIDAEREQWSDGVNLMCIRPGVVMAYDRNFVTNQALRKHGIKVIEIPSSELSRGRGGSHCMAMALVREEAQ